MTASLTDTALDLAGMEARNAGVLARLSARALEGGVPAGIDPLDLAECAQALESLAWPSGDLLERLEVWLGPEQAQAKLRAQRLRNVLQVCGTVATCADPAQAAPVIAALQRLSYQLGALVERRAQPQGEGARVDGGLLERLQRHLDSRPGGQGAALVLVHCAAVDRIDATRGLRAGDAVVQRIASALRAQVLRAADALEAAERDEFACLLDPVSSEGVAILAGQKMVRVLEAPIEVEDFAVAAEPCVGIALFPEHGRDAEELLQHAKAALRDARGGQERIVLYRADIPGTRFDESRYAARLRQAIHGAPGLQLHFQPQMDFASGRLVGAEALLRWHDERLGAVPPNVAIAAAEASGLINDLTLWVISSAIQHCARFRERRPEFTMSINVSPSNLHEADLPHHVSRALRTWSVEPKGVIFEVTETAIVTDQKQAMEALEQLKRLGVGIAIDDFGTGYSSMYYLAQMPLDELKIDIMFVRQMLELPQHAKIVRSLIDLAHNLELEVVAEGVENEAIASALKHLGCERAQGWHVGKPMPAEELLALL